MRSSPTFVQVSSALWCGEPNTPNKAQTAVCQILREYFLQSENHISSVSVREADTNPNNNMMMRQAGLSGSMLRRTKFSKQNVGSLPKTKIQKCKIQKYTIQIIQNHYLGQLTFTKSGSSWLEAATPSLVMSTHPIQYVLYNTSGFTFLRKYTKRWCFRFYELI